MPIINHNEIVDDTIRLSSIALAEARTRWNEPMPKIGEKFCINAGGCMVEAEWRGEFTMRNGTHYWVFECSGCMYVKDRLTFKDQGKSVKLAKPEGQQTP